MVGGPSTSSDCNGRRIQKTGFMRTTHSINAFVADFTVVSLAYNASDCPHSSARRYWAALPLRTRNMPFLVYHLFWIAVVCLISGDGWVLTSTGSTIELAGIPYYVSSKAFASVPNSLYTQSLAGGKSVGTPWIPVTVVKATSGAVSITELQSTLKSFGESDDVWTTDFLSGNPQRP